jgi:FKBP-type peptidyl-prolyl cis-trans isomerase
MKMVSYTSLFVTLGLVAHASAATEFSVTVYEGPKECEDADKVKSGDFLSMHYTGTIDKSSATGEKGEKFDSSRDRDQTFDFKIGQGQVIAGWDQGVIGLCKGAKVCSIR